MSDKTRLLVTAALVGLGIALTLRPGNTKPASRRANRQLASSRHQTHYNWNRLVGDEFKDDVQELEASWTSCLAGQLIEQLHGLRQELTSLREQYFVSAGDSTAPDDASLRNLAYFRDASIRLRAILEGLSNQCPDLNLRDLALRFANARFIADDACDLQKKAQETVAGVGYDMAVVFESVNDLHEIEDGVDEARKRLESDSVPAPFFGGIELAAVGSYLKSCVQAA